MSATHDGRGWKLPTPRWIVLDDGEARLALDGDNYTMTIEGLDQYGPNSRRDGLDQLRVRTYPRSKDAA